MARTGLYKSDVKKARDALIAQGKHPSVDAVRVALGNTGSKTTIHKYLKELDEEDGGADGRRVSISEALQDLVARLAAQLQDEAAARIDEIEVQGTERERKHAEALATLKKEIDALSMQLQGVETEAQQEKSAHEHTRQALHNESIARHTAEQQVAGLKERLAENETHRQSLEDKHKHAREVLEHYRQSIKEQRDQDQRRHEQQVQQLQAEIRQLQQSLIVKQDEVTRSNQEGARLIADLSHAQKALYEQQNVGRQLEQKLANLQAVEQRGHLLETQLAAGQLQAQALQDQLTTADAKAENLSGQVRDLELALARSQTKLEALQEVVTELRTFLNVRKEKDAGEMA